MFVILILTTMAVIIGLAHVVQILWTKSNIEHLNVKYKPGTEAHRINSANLNPRRLPITIGCTLVAIAGLAILVRTMTKLSENVSSLVVPGLIVGVAMAALTLGMAFSHYAKK